MRHISDNSGAMHTTIIWQHKHAWFDDGGFASVFSYTLLKTILIYKIIKKGWWIVEWLQQTFSMLWVWQASSNIIKITTLPDLFIQIFQWQKCRISLMDLSLFYASEAISQVQFWWTQIFFLHSENRVDFSKHHNNKLIITYISWVVEIYLCYHLFQL